MSNQHPKESYYLDTTSYSGLYVMLSNVWSVCLLLRWRHAAEGSLSAAVDPKGLTIARQEQTRELERNCPH